MAWYKLYLRLWYKKIPKSEYDEMINFYRHEEYKSWLRSLQEMEPEELKEELRKYETKLIIKKVEEDEERRKNIMEALCNSSQYITYDPSEVYETSGPIYEPKHIAHRNNKWRK